MPIKTYPKGSKERLSTNFHAYEFDCPCSRCKTTKIDTTLVAGLQAIRNRTGKELYPNAYRCPEHNAEVPNAAKKSKHMDGTAADISVKGVAPSTVAKIAEEVGFLGIGLYDTFVHVDTRTSKFFWKGHEQKPVSSFVGVANTTTADELRTILESIAKILKDAGFYK